MDDARHASETIGERLRRIAQARFEGNKSALARALEMKPASFGKYLRNDRRPGAAVLERLTRLGINVNWLLTGEGRMMVSSRDARPRNDSPSMSAADLEHTEPRFYPIPVVRPHVREGGTLHLDEIGEPEWLSEREIQRRYHADPDRLRTFVISWDQMADTIRPGDRVRAVLLGSDVPLAQVTDGRIYLIKAPNGIRVVRIYDRRGSYDEEASPEGSPSASERLGEGGGALLVGDAPDASDEVVTPEEWAANYRAVACVLEVIRSLR